MNCEICKKGLGRKLAIIQSSFQTCSDPWYHKSCYDKDIEDKILAKAGVPRLQVPVSPPKEQEEKDFTYSEAKDNLRFCPYCFEPIFLSTPRATGYSCDKTGKSMKERELLKVEDIKPAQSANSEATSERIEELGGTGDNEELIRKLWRKVNELVKAVHKLIDKVK